ncbi:MAG: LON peptidase substrate-binding domain-containing protein [Flavobacteriales bacterium]
MPLPLFPLRLLPLPGETVGLHVFEPRFQELFNALEAMQVEEFGIPFCHDSKIWRVGATMRLVTVQKRMAGGKRDVAVTSTGLFRLQSLDETPVAVPYPQGDIQPIDDWAHWPLGSACAQARDALIEEMKARDMHVGNLENQGLLRIVQHLGIDAMQRAEILSQPTVVEMQWALLERLELTRKLLTQRPLEGGTFFVN